MAGLYRAGAASSGMRHGFIRFAVRGGVLNPSRCNDRRVPCCTPEGQTLPARGRSPRAGARSCRAPTRRTSRVHGLNVLIVQRHARLKQRGEQGGAALVDDDLVKQEIQRCECLAARCGAHAPDDGGRCHDLLRADHGHCLRHAVRQGRHVGDHGGGPHPSGDHRQHHRHRVLHRHHAARSVHRDDHGRAARQACRQRGPGVQHLLPHPAGPVRRRRHRLHTATCETV